MSYKLEKDTKTELYDYTDEEILTVQDLRLYVSPVSISSSSYPSSPAISFVNAYNCLCNAMRKESPVPSALALFQMATNDVTNTLCIYNTFMKNIRSLPTETEWPYDEDRMVDNVPAGGGSQMLPVILRRVSITERGICEPLSRKHPVICALKMTDNYVSSDPAPEEEEDEFGYAAMCFVGFNKHDEKVIAKDPYNNRFISLSYDYIFNTENCVDAYALILGSEESDEKSPKFI